MIKDLLVNTDTWRSILRTTEVRNSVIGRLKKEAAGNLTVYSSIEFNPKLV